MIEALGRKRRSCVSEPVPRTCDEQDRCEGAGLRAGAVSFDHPEGRAHRTLSLRLCISGARYGRTGTAERFDQRLGQEDPFAETADEMSFYLHADGGFLKLDGDGRITVTDFIREHTGISAEVTFAGANTIFRCGIQTGSWRIGQGCGSGWRKSASRKTCAFP